MSNISFHLMFPSGMVEIPRLTKRESVMPAQAGIQGGEVVEITENLDSRFRGKDGRGSRLSVGIVQIPRLRAESCLICWLFALLLLPACAGLPVRGRIGGQAIDTRVDAEVARYYLASYLSGQRNNPALDGRIADTYKNSRNDLPDRAELKRLSEEFSVDFAAAYLADRIIRVPENRRFRELFEENRRAFSQKRLKLPNGAADYEVMFIPTYLYKRLPITGGDFAVPKQALQRIDLPFHFVETVEDGAVETNADIVAAAIGARAQSDRRLIVISASKSGPEVALALTRLGGAATRHVVAWINTVGALQGTPLTDEQLLPEVEDFVGAVNVAGMQSLMTERSRRRFQSFRLPDHILVVNYFGIPLSGSVSSWARAGFTPLSKHGPNDGILLLSDMILPGGITVAELGLDHFLLDQNLDAATVGLVTAVMRWMGEGPPRVLQVSD